MVRPHGDVEVGVALLPPGAAIVDQDGHGGVEEELPVVLCDLDHGGGPIQGEGEQLPGDAWIKGHNVQLNKAQVFLVLQGVEPVAHSQKKSKYDIRIYI